MMPTSTVSTNVTAPHSRRSTAQFTSRRLYWALVVFVGRGAFLFLLLALVHDPDEVLRPRERLPTLRAEVFALALAFRLMVEDDAPLVEGAQDFHLDARR